jgi:hypothetical protein
MIIFFICSIILVYGGVAYARSQLWGNTLLMSKVWFENDGQSVRSSLLYSSQLASMGRISDADKVLKHASGIHPKSVALRLSMAIINCKFEHKGFNAQIYSRLALTAPVETAAQDGLKIFYKMLSDGENCKDLTSNALSNIAINYIKNPRYQSYPQSISSLYVYLSDLAVQNKNLNDSIRYRDKACDYYCTSHMRYNQAVLLASAGLDKEALIYLDKADSLRSWYRDLKDPFTGRMIEQLKKQILSKPKK